MNCRLRLGGRLGIRGHRFCCVLLLLLGGLTAFGGDPSLMVHLKFDEGDGQVARDSSGRGHDARLVATQWEEFGVRGQALRLDGSCKSYVEIPWSKDLDLPSNFTYSLWYKMDPKKYGMSLFLRGNYRQSFQIYFYESFIAFACMGMKGHSLIYTPVPRGTDILFPFHQLVVTGEQAPGSQKMIIRFYVDGKLRRNDMRFGGQTDFERTGQVPMPKNQPLTLGRYGSHEGQWFTGLLDEVKIHNRALKSAEIKAEYVKLSEEEE